jgi:hypothetical protein
LRGPPAIWSSDAGAYLSWLLTRLSDPFPLM